MAVHAGLLGIGDQHHIVERRGLREPGPLHHQHVELGVLVDLQHVAVGQHRPQCIDRRGERHLLGKPLMPQRQIGGASRRHGQRQSDQRRARRIQAVRFGVDGDEATGGDLRQEGAQCGLGGNRRVGTETRCHLRRLGWFGERQCGLGATWRRLHRRCGGCRCLAVQPQAGDDAAEPLCPQPRRQLGLVILPRMQLIGRQRQRRIGAQRHQLARETRLVGMLDQAVAPLRRLHRRRRCQHAVQVAELVDELGGTLGADARYARHVVHGVADQRLDVDHLVRRDAELLHHFGGADRLLLDRIQHLHAWADELHQVLVGRHDGGLPTRFVRGLRIGGDQVVRFPVFQLDRRHAECRGRLAHQVELRHQIVGWRRAMCLVGIVQPVAECLPAGIEDYRDVRADMLAQQLGQHVGEAEHRVHRRAVGPGHRRQRVVGAEDEARSVDQDQMQLLVEARGLLGLFQEFSVRWRGRLLRLSPGLARGSAHTGANSRGTARTGPQCAGRRADGPTPCRRRRRRPFGRRRG